MTSSWLRCAAALSLLALASPALAASDALPEGYLPAGKVAHILIDKGTDLRGLGLRHGYYVADVVNKEGTLQHLGINPRTAEPLPPFFTASKDTPSEFRPRITAAQALSLAEAKGCKDLRTLRIDEQDIWVVEARECTARIDAMTGDAADAAK